MGSFYDGNGHKKLSEVTVPVQGVDPDEELWRRLSGNKRVKEDLLPYTQQQMARQARYLYLTNPLAHRIVEYVVAFTVGGGVTFEAEDPRVQGVLEAFWNDPVNAWHRKLPVRVRELSLYGEQFYPVSVHPISGAVRLGYINPLDVVKVNVDPYNVEIIESIELAPSLSQGSLSTVLEVIRYDDRNEKFIGDVFVFAINKSSDATRGTSDLLSLIDWLNLHDEILFNAAERTAHMNMWLWDVTLTGFTEQQIASWLNSVQARTPRPGSIRAHNENVTWNAVTPKLEAGELTDSANIFKKHILGGAGIPGFFFGETYEAGARSVVESMAEPTYKTFQLRQQFIKDMLCFIFSFVIDKAVEKKVLPKSVNRSFNIYMPKISLRDLQRTGGAMFRIAQSLEIAQRLSWINDEQARQIFLSTVDQLGIGFEIRKEGESTWQKVEKPEEQLLEHKRK